MGNIRQRVAMLEKVVVPDQSFGKHSLELNVRDGERCDVVLQQALDEKGISLSKVSYISIVGGVDTQYERDFQNYPEWVRLQKLNAAPKIWMIMIVRDKEEWEEYQRATQDIT
jgi:hypothetical protein